MGLETGTRVTDLVVTNPTATDLRSQGDDHLRLVKTVVKNDVLNVLGAQAVQNITVATGAITPAALSSAIINLTGEGSVADNLDTITATNKYSGNIIMLKGADAANAVTVKHNTGNIQLLRSKDAVLDSTTEFLLLYYDGTNWREVIRGDLSELLDGDTVANLTITALTSTTATLSAVVALATLTATGAAVASTPAAGKALLAALATDGFSVAKSAMYFLNEAGTRWEFGGGAAKNIAGIGVDLTASYIDATGTAGTNNTNMTVKSVTIKGGSLNAKKRGLSILVHYAANASVALMTVSLKLNGVTIGTLNTSSTTPESDTVDVFYIDATHCTVEQTEGNGGAHVTTINVAGFDNTADQLLEVVQTAVPGMHIIVYTLFVKQLG